MSDNEIDELEEESEQETVAIEGNKDFYEKLLNRLKNDG